MRRRQNVGTKYDTDLDSRLDRNQDEMVDELIEPHSTRLTEMLNSQHKICASYKPVQETQPTQGRGRIVWNNAYRFQPHGPSYLDPVPDPSMRHDD